MKNQTLNWANLRRSKCPKCNHGLSAKPLDDLIECGNPLCTFVITDTRMKEIVASMNKQAIERPMYRQGIEVEDMRKVEHPQCSLCHDKHDPQARCEGFGE